MKIRIAMYIHPLPLSLSRSPLFPLCDAPSLTPSLPSLFLAPVHCLSPQFLRLSIVSPLSFSLSPLLLLLLLPHLLLPLRSQSTLLRPLVVCVTFLVTTRRVVLPPRSSSVYFWTMDPKKRFNDPIRSRTGTRTYAPTDEHRRKS